MFLLVWHTNQYSPSCTTAGSWCCRWRPCCWSPPRAHPASRSAGRSGWAPLRWIGVRSYGIYLWHEPIIVLTTPATGRTTNLVRGRAAGRRDVRDRGAVLALRRGADPPRRAGQAVGSGAHGPLAAADAPPGVRTSLAAAIVLLVLTSLALAGVKPPAISSSGSAAPLTSARTRRAVGVARPTGGGVRPAGPAVAARAVAGPAAAPVLSTPTGTEGVRPDRRTGPLRTSCTVSGAHRRLHLGGADLRATTCPIPASGSRRSTPASARRTAHGDHRRDLDRGDAAGRAERPDGGQEQVKSGYNGCWVIALGTNDTADVYVGSSVAAERRDQGDDVGDRQPAGHVGQREVAAVAAGPYSEQNMEQWNQALHQACPSTRTCGSTTGLGRQGQLVHPRRHPLHRPATRPRHLIADALAEAFPPSWYDSPAAAWCTPSRSTSKSTRPR